MRSAHLSRDPQTEGEVELSLLFEKFERQVVMDPNDALFIAADAIDVVDFGATIGERIRFRRMKAMALTNTSRFDAALECCREAEAIDGSSTAPIEVARIHLAAMQPLANLDRAEEAIELGRKAIDVLMNADEPELAGRGALNIGSILAMTGRSAESLDYFEMAKRALANEPTVLGQIETNRGTSLAALNRFMEAEVAFQLVAALSNTEEASWAAAVAEGNLAYLASRQGRISEGLRHFETARQLFGRLDLLADIGRLEAEEASLLFTASLTAEAEEIFLRAISLLGEYGTPVDLAAAEIAYCEVLVEDGRIETASYFLQEASSRIDTSSNLHVLEQVLALNARIALYSGDLDAADAAIERGLAQTDDRPVQGIRWALLSADLAIARGQHDVARSMLHQALAASEKSHVTPFAGEALQRLAELERAAGNVATANVHARGAIAAFERVRGIIQADQLRLSYQYRRTRVYEALYRSLAAEESQLAQLEAVTVSEHIRNRKMLDALSHGGSRIEQLRFDAGNSPLVAELDGHERWVNWMYSALGGGLEPTPGQLDELGLRERGVAQLSGRLATVESAASFWEPARVEEIQTRIPPGQAILAYVASGETFSAHLISAGSVRCVQDFASLQHVGENVAEIQFQVGRALAHNDEVPAAARARRLQRDIDDALESLFQQILQPMEPWLAEVEHLHVVPAGDLHLIPFSALRDGSGYLIDRLSINTVPSITVLSRLDKISLSLETSGSALVIGAPDDSAPGLGAEAIRVAERLKGSRLIFGPDTRKASVDFAMQSAGTIHMACHGRFDGNRRGASGLKLADGWLALNEIMRLRLNQPLVVLTGCETGRARFEQGDGPVGIAVALVSAGAGAVVNSLWKTHDGAMQLMIDAFYDAFDQDMDLSQAMRSSQLKIRGEFAHPAFWASLCCLEGMPKGEVA